MVANVTNGYFLLAAAAGLIWAAVIILDRITLTSLYKHPLQALVNTSILGMWGYGVSLAVERTPPTGTNALIAFVAGVVFMLSTALYFYAMDISDEAAEVAAWDASSPVFIALISLGIGIPLMAQQWIGVLIVCIALICLQYHKGATADLRVPLKVYRMYLAGNALCIAISFVLMGVVLQNETYWNVYPYYLTGFCTGIAALLLPSVRQAYRDTWRRLVPLWWLLIGMEILNVLGLLTTTYAIEGVHPAVAATLADTFPIYILLSGPLLRRLGCSEEAFSKEKNIFLKTGILAILLIGIGLLGNV